MNSPVYSHCVQAQQRLLVSYMPIHGQVLWSEWHGQGMAGQGRAYSSGLHAPICCARSNNTTTQEPSTIIIYLFPHPIKAGISSSCYASIMTRMGQLGSVSRCKTLAASPNPFRHTQTFSNYVHQGQSWKAD
jgi:hypothetical protein